MFFEYLKFRFFNRQFRKTKPQNIFLKREKSEIREMFEKQKNKKILFLQNQVGRGGAKWLMDILNTISSVVAYGERNAKKESYYRYCRSHNINDYNVEFLDLIKSEIISDWNAADVSYISSPYFSHGLDYLYENLLPKKLIILVPSTKRLMTSFKNKGWYKQDLDIDLNKFNNLPKEFLGKENHFYGRMINLGVDNMKFNSLSQIGKISLFMSKTLEIIYKQIKNFDKSKILIFRLDEADQNYNYCKNFIKKLDLNLFIDEKKFLKFKKRTSGLYENKEIRLSDKEQNEYNFYTEEYKFYEKKILEEFDSKHI